MEKKFFCKDRVLALIVLALSAFFIINASKLDKSTLANDPGPQLFPYIGAAIMIVCAIALLIKPTDGGKGLRLDGPAKKRLLIILGIYIIYVLASVYFSVLYATPIILFVISYLFSKSSKPDLATGKRIVQTIIYTIIICAFLYLIYVVVLGTVFKTGALYKALFN